MFCPNCASQNDGDLKFCRGCGQDISLVSLSLKGHTPVVLAGMIDKLFNRRNMLLLKNGILHFLMALVNLTWFGFQFGSGNLGSLLFLGLYFLPLSVVLIFKGYTNLAAFQKSRLPGWTPFQEITGQKKMFCPECGEPDETAGCLCTNCGQNLQTITEALKYSESDLLQHYIYAEMTSGVKIKDERQKFRLIHVPFNSKAQFGVSALTLAVAIAAEMIGQTSFFWLMLSYAFLLFGSAVWEFVIEKRFAEDKMGIDFQFETAELEAETQKQLTPIKAEDEFDQFEDAETGRELQKIDDLETETKPLSESSQKIVES